MKTIKNMQACNKTQANEMKTKYKSLDEKQFIEESLRFFKNIAANFQKTNS